MLSNAAWSFSRSTVDAEACWLISADCWRSITDVPSIRLEVVSLRAVIWSRTSFWSPRAWATMTAVRRAETVVVVARSTPRISSRLLRRMTSIERYPWTPTASWAVRSCTFWRT